MPPTSKPHITNSQVFKAFWQGMKPYSRLYFFGIALFTVYPILNVIVPLFYKKFFDILENADVLGQTNILGQATNRGVEASMLIQVISTIALIHLVQWILNQSAKFTFNHVDSKIIAKLKQNAFGYLLPHSHGFFANNFTGSLVQKIGRFSRAYENMSDTTNYQIIPLTITVIGAITVTWFIAPVISLIIIAWVSFFFIFNIIYSKIVFKYSIASAAADSKTGAALADSIGNHSAITNFTGQDFEIKNFHRVTEEQARRTRTTWNMREVSSTFQIFLLSLVEFIVFFYAVKFWEKDAITIGTFVLIQSYIFGVSGQLWSLSRIIRVFYEAMADSREMVEIMNQPYEITDLPLASELEIKKAAIDLKNVSFVYDGTNKEVLKDVNFSIVPDEKVALIGPSGAGKTTITRLLLRLHNPSNGNILIDGQDISKVTQGSLRKNISLVPQDPVLFHRSLMENIRYGSRDATDEEVIAAAKLAYCDDFIDVLPNKYETLVGERGVKLSGGERQRIAIARAILKAAPIIILDEATSSLDSHSESLIQSALDTLMRGRTTIVIAHRLSTIRKMDRIIVMRDGGIFEEGTHSSLIKNEGSLYKKLWDLQVSGFIAD